MERKIRLSPIVIVLAGIVLVFLLYAGVTPNNNCTKVTETINAKVLSHSERYGVQGCNTHDVTILQWEDTGETFSRCHHLGNIGDVLKFPRPKKVCVE